MALSQETHTTTAREAKVYLTKNVEGGDVYVGCFGCPEAESPREYAARWDEFARQMFRYGVEPTQDEPTDTVNHDGVLFDHYVLRALSSVGVVA